MVGVYPLHEDILYEIFVRMPTKPLLKFRCLSKHWNRLISDYFMKSRSRRMILLPFQPIQAIDSMVPSDRIVCPVSELPSCFTNPGGKYHVMVAGSVEGIVVLVVKDDMVLYNPLTGASKIVPSPPLSTCERPNNGYGFCYGTTADDLMIVRVTHEGNGFEHRWCDVFRLKKGVWSTKYGTLVGLCRITHHAGAYVNGFLYWTAYRYRYFILALDVKEMVFSEIQLPFSHHSGTCLGTSGGRLHVFRDKGTKFELWALNENVVKKSWSRVLMSNGLPSVHPLWILDEGKILMREMQWKRRIVIYNMVNDSDEVYELNTSDVGLVWRLLAMEYVESLISPSHLCSSW